MRKRPCLLAIAAFSASVFCCNRIVLAQATNSGSLVLQVADISNGSLPACVLTLKDTATGVVRNAQTLETGGYRFEALPYGTYSLTIAHDGFQTVTYDHVVVRTGVSTRLDVALKVGSTDTKIVVSSLDVPVIETSSNTLSTTLDLQQVQNLPLSGRDLLQLAYLVPGAVGGTFNGVAQAAIQANVDGVTTTSSRFKSGTGLASVVSPRVENIQEVTVQTGELDPSQGAGQSAAQALFATNSGTNKFHGRIFEDHQNSGLNANSWYNNAIGQHRPKLIINSFGANLGGPILKNKLFFFVDYSQTIEPSSYTSSAYVPNATAASGLYSYYTNCSAASSTACPVATIDVYHAAKAAGYSGSINSVIAAQMQKNMASYKYGTLTSTSTDLNGQTLTWQQSAKLTNYYPAARIDWTISQKHSLSLSGTAFNVYNQNLHGALFPGPDYSDQVSSAKNRQYVFSLGETWTIKPTVLNELRVGYLYDALFDSPEFNGRDVTKMQAQNWSFGTSGVTYTTPVGHFYPYMTLSDNVSWQKGAHTIKFGGNVFHQQDHYYNPPVGYPNYYLGLTPQDPVSNVLTNAVPQSGSSLPANYAGTVGGAQALYATLTGRVDFVYALFAYLPQTGGYGPGTYNLNEVTLGGGVYLMDSWKALPGLTLNYGLRWDMISAVSDKSRAYTAPDISSLWGPSGVGNLFRPGVLTGNQDPTFVARGTVYNPSLINPEPQVGLAWNPRGGDSMLGKFFGDGKSVIRASFTLKNYTEGGQNFWRYASNAGFNFFQSAYLYPDTSGISGTFKPGSLSLGQGLPSYGLSPQSYANVVHESDLTFNGQDAATINPNIHQPYVESYTLGFQHQFGHSSAVEVRYVGNHSVHSWIGTNYNQVNIQENGFLQEFRNAQENLAINAAAGRPANDFENHGNGKPIPLITQAFGGAGAGDFTNASYALMLENGAAGTLASTLASSPSYFCNIAGNGFSPCAGVAAAGSSYPSNYFQANPYMAGTGATLLDSSGMANFNSLQAEFRQQVSHGLEVNVSYTYSKNLGTTVQGAADNVKNFYDLHNPRLNYMPSAFDIRHVFIGNGTYNLPLGKNKMFFSNSAWQDQVFGGWTAGAIVRLQSGSPALLGGGFSTVNGSADSGVDFSGGASAKALQSSIHISRRQDGNPGMNFLPNQYRAVGHANYAYVGPHTEAGTFGHLSFLYGPRWVNADLSVTKAVSLHENVKLNLQGEFLNAFNHPTFGIGDVGVQSSTFGTVGGPFNAARRIELRGNITF